MCRKTRSLTLLLAVLLLFAIPDDPSASLPRKRILILFPYESNTPGFVKFDEGFGYMLRSSEEYEFEFYVEAMDLTRFPDERYHQRLMEFLHEKYAGITIDLIVAIQLPSFDLLLKHGPESFHNVPVILYSQDRRLLGDPKSIPGAAVVTGQLDIKGTLDLAIRLHPGVDKVFVISGASRFDRLLEGIAREEFRSFENQVRFQYLSGLPMHELTRYVSLLPEDSVVFYLSVLRDGNGKAFKSPEALTLISKHASVPIYSVSETYIDSGIVGGRLISHLAHGAMAGRVALRILAGEEPTDLGLPEESTSRYIFHARELKRWGILEKNLPPGSDVRYSDYSVWETHRWQIVWVVSILIIQTLLISALVTSLRRQRRTERALKKSADEWQTTFDSTKDRIMLLDRDFQILRVNAAVASSLALPLDQILGRHCYSVVHGTNTPPGNCPCARTVKIKGHEEAIIYEGKWNAWLFVSIDPILNDGKEITGFVHTVKDVTDQKRAAEAIEASEAFNRAVLASLKNQVAILDREGTVLAVNESWRQSAEQELSPLLAGLSPGESYLEVCRQSVHAPAGLADQVLDGIHSVLDGNRETFSFEYSCDSPSGPRWFLMKVMPFKTPEGGVVISHTDISERKSAELEAQLRREELTHVTRIVTIGELATSLAHEINQPMTAILCNAEAAQRFLSRAAPDLDEVRRILDDIIHDDRRAGEVIRRIRTLVKKEIPRREAVVINDAVRETITLVRSACFLEGLSIVEELGSELPTLQCDHVQLQQVILNLLLNSTAAMRETPPALRRVVIRTALQDRRSILVSVRDSGTGIDKDAMDRLFEPFYTTKADGLGMGLSISRSIIKAHGGTIWAENNEGGGATFSFTLPLDSGEQP